MEILLVLFGAGAALELSAHAGVLWRLRAVLSVTGVLLTVFATGALLVAEWNLWSAMLGVITGYRVFNMLRILEGRMHEWFLRRTTLRTSSVLIGLQALVAASWYVWDGWHETGQIMWLLLAVLQLFVAIVLCSSTIRRLKRTAWPTRSRHLSDAELPTITVAIPARNETDDLRACLESLVRCDYPKLEILVLDDCSQLRRTPEIIRDFAHDGVRFIKGEDPKLTWLAKNQAYDHLAREASGEYIVFCGVDVRFGRESLRQLTEMMRAKHKEMVCILPWRSVSAERRFAVTQAMRYFWELVPPRRLFARPPILSTCWIIKKDTLHQVGGFEAVTRSIVPEAHFAKALIKRDAYSFIRASQASGIESTKPAAEQRLTAVRMRYPQLHRRPENVLLTAAATALFLLLPFILAIAGFWIAIGLAAQLLAALTAVVLILTYLQVVLTTRTGSWWFGLIALPYGACYDIGMLHYSMWKYEFSVVDWKGRNVCIPAMHVIPHLPKI